MRDAVGPIGATVVVVVSWLSLALSPAGAQPPNPVEPDTAQASADQEARAELDAEGLYALYVLPTLTLRDAVTGVAQARAEQAKKDCPDAPLQSARRYLHRARFERLAEYTGHVSACDYDDHVMAGLLYMNAYANIELAGKNETALMELDGNGKLDPNAVAHAEAALDAIQRLHTIGDPKTVVLDDYIQMMVAEANRLAGNYTEADIAYSTVATDKRGPLFHKASIDRATNFYRARDWENALEALSEVIGIYEEYPMIERLYVLRGRTKLALGKSEAAAKDFEEVVFNWPWKSAATHAERELVALEAAGTERPRRSFDERYDRTRLLRKNKHWDIAEARFKQLLADAKTASEHSTGENKIRLQLALNFYWQSRYDETLFWLNQLAKNIEEGHASGVDPQYVYDLIVRSHASAGRYDEALAAVHVRDARLSKRAKEAKLAEFYTDMGRWKQALRVQDKRLSESAKRSWSHSFLLYKAGKHGTAARNFGALAKRAKGETKAKYLYWKGRALMNDGDFEPALATFASVAQTYPRSYYGYQSLNRTHEIDQFLKEDQDKKGGLVASTGPFAADGEKARSGSESNLTVGADSSVGVTKKNPALAGFDAPIPAPPGGKERVPVAGITTDANESVVELAADVREPVPTTLGGIHWNGPPAANGFLEVHGEATAGHAKSTKQGNAYGPGVERLGALREAADKYGELFPALKRAYALDRMGFETEARWEARDVSLEYRALRKASGGGRKKPSATKPFQLGFKLWRHYIDNRREARERTGYWGFTTNERRFANFEAPAERAAEAKRQRAIIDVMKEMEPLLVEAWMEVGDYHVVRKEALRKAFYRTSPLSGDRKDEWMRAYPRAFPRLVRTHAQEEGLNPYVMWALMTVESSHNPDSISYADARGLLQVIPRTGIKVATTLGVDEYGPHDLLDERLSIRFGTWYFAQLVKKFDGQHLLAMAGYNGGPHNVARWVNMRGHSMQMDEFIETIPFDQARLYAKKVTKFVGLYRQIYEDEPMTYVGNNLDVSFAEQPNY